MKILEKIEELKPLVIIKTIGIAIVVLVFFAVASQLLMSSFGTLTDRNYAKESISSYNNSFGLKSASTQSMRLSSRNVSDSYGGNEEFAPGSDAEDFEVKEYNATIKTRKFEKTCSTISDLKNKEYVIFQNSQKYNTNCNYSFKVANKNLDEILAIVNSLKPENISENKYTIKQVVSDYTNEVDLLNKKIESIDDTLNNAVKAYDDITKLATQTRDVENLAKIITSKIDIIERLTMERMKINSQLDRIERSKSQELDRLEYSYFNVNIIENKFVDTVSIKNSWQRSIKNFVMDLNQTLQDVTINLATFLFRGIQIALYLFILLLVIKHGWKFTKRIWKK
jgi:hypothetical protein